MPTIQFDQQTRVDPALTAPDAQGAQFTPVLGQAMEQLGHEGSRLASDMNRIQYMQQRADGVAAITQNIAHASKDFTDYSEDQKGKYGEQATGYAQNMYDKLSDWQNKLVEQQHTPELKRMAAERAATITEHFYGRASVYENETRRAWRTNAIDEGIQASSDLMRKDPSLFEPLMKETLASITGAMGDLHPEQAVSLRQKAQRLFAESAGYSYADSHPQDTANAIMPAIPQSPDSVQEKIKSAAGKYGVDPHNALAMAYFESKFDPSAVNPKSSAAGIYQQTNGNWADYGKGGNKLDPDQNIDAGLRFMSDNAHAWRDTFKKDPTLPEQYSMHLLGLGGGMALAKAPNDMPFLKLVQQYDPKDAQATVSNNGFDGLTVGQVKAKIAGWMQPASIATAGYASAPVQGSDAAKAASPDESLPWIKYMQPNQWQALLTHSQNLLKKDDAAAHALVTQQYNDTVAAYQNGENAVNPPTRDSMIKAGLPAYKIDMLQQDLHYWQNYGAAYSQLSKQSPAEQAQTLAQQRPSGGEPGYAEHVAAFDHMQAAARQIGIERAHDPMAYDQKRGLGITAPIDFTNPQFLTGPLAGRFVQATQVAQKQGTDWTLATNQEAEQLGEFFDKANPKEAVSYLQSIRAAADTPEHFTAAMAQISKQHPILATVGQIAEKDPQTALLIMQGDRLMNPGKNGSDKEDKLKFVMPDNAKFAAAWDKARGPAFAGLPTQESNDDLAATIAAYTALVPAGARSKDIDQEKFKQAMDLVTPTAIDHRGNQVLVPRGTNPDTFNDTVASLWAPTLKNSGLDANDYPLSHYSLVSSGTPGEYLPTVGSMPLMSHGQPVRINIGDTPPAPTMPQLENPTQVQRSLKGKKLTRDDLTNLPMQRRFR